MGGFERKGPFDKSSTQNDRSKAGYDYYVVHLKEFHLSSLGVLEYSTLIDAVKQSNPILHEYNIEVSLWSVYESDLEFSKFSATNR